MSADFNGVQRAIIFLPTVMSTLVYSTLNALVCMTICIFHFKTNLLYKNLILVWLKNRLFIQISVCEFLKIFPFFILYSYTYKRWSFTKSCFEALFLPVRGYLREKWVIDNFLNRAIIKTLKMLPIQQVFGLSSCFFRDCATVGREADFVLGRYVNLYL